MSNNEMQCASPQCGSQCSTSSSSVTIVDRLDRLFCCSNYCARTVADILEEHYKILGMQSACERFDEMLNAQGAGKGLVEDPFE